MNTRKVMKSYDFQQLTASTDFIDAAVNTIKASCESFIYRNTSLWVSRQPGEPPQPPSEFTDIMCPNNCTGRGSCHDGIN